MPDLPEYTVEELIARYTYEPELNDLYVEGEGDVDILRRCCDVINSEWTVYSISVVDIEPAMLEKYQLTDGQKQRVICLAAELFSALARATPTYRCLVDRDTDHWFEDIRQIPGLLYTAYATLEMYFWSENFIRDLVVHAGRARIADWQIFYKSFSSCLLDLYALRLAERDLRLGLGWIAFERSVAREGDQVTFDVHNYVQKLLMHNGAMSHQEKFLGKWREWRPKIDADERQAIRGHDFTELLAWSIHKFKGLSSMGKRETVFRFMVFAAGFLPELQGLLQKEVRQLVTVPGGGPEPPGERPVEVCE